MEWTALVYSGTLITVKTIQTATMNPTAPASMATHTPTPWHFNAKHFTICSIECGNEKPVAVLQTVNNAVARNETLSANAAFIVRACNSHAQLVALAESLIESLSSARDTLDGIERRKPYAGVRDYTGQDGEALASSSTEAGDEMTRIDNALFDARAALTAAQE